MLACKSEAIDQDVVTTRQKLLAKTHIDNSKVSQWERRI